MPTIPVYPPLQRIVFPPVESALDKPDGLLCVGGTLSKENLVTAYECGVFPWFSEGELVHWWSPSERAILDSSKVHISKSTRKLLMKYEFEVTFDKAFESVIEACAMPTERRPETWITEEMKLAYVHLFYERLAHSVEVWMDGWLVGGLYGIYINNVFCGESMFSETQSASQIALIYLARFLQIKGCEVIDCIKKIGVKSIGPIRCGLWK